MVLSGSGFAGSTFASASSDIPFLNALIPCAMSPISSEILPRPNNSRTTTTTTSQCQILNEPIGYPPRPAGGAPPIGDVFLSSAEPSPRQRQNKDLGPSHLPPHP